MPLFLRVIFAAEQATFRRSKLTRVPSGFSFAKKHEFLWVSNGPVLVFVYFAQCIRFFSFQLETKQISLVLVFKTRR